MTDFPSVDAGDLLTIVICTYNRAADLRVTLEGIRELAWREVVVVDNASTDGTPSVLRDYPWVRVLRNSENIGVPGVATGVSAATTPYVLLLDDDAIPDASVPAKIVERFEAQPAVAAIACHIETPDGQIVTQDWSEHPVLFWGCGAGIRVAAIGDTRQMFYPKLRLHGTELDLCIRLYSQGYRVDYDSTALVVHRFSGTNRSHARRMRTVTYASIRFAWDHFSWRAATLAAFRAATSRRLQSVEALRGWLWGLADVLADVPDIRRRRSVVSAQVEEAYLSAVWEYQPRGTPRIPKGFPASYLEG